MRELRFEPPDWSMVAFGLIEIRESDSGFRASEEEALIGFKFMSFDAQLEKTPMKRNP